VNADRAPQAEGQRYAARYARSTLILESEKNMKTKYPWVLAPGLLLCLLALTIYGQRQNPARTTWEYRSVFSTSASLEFVLNDLGAQGWELIAIDVNATNKTGFKGTTYYLKRAK